MPIRVLPDVVAAQIAAGEVVERPASVVKELIENALAAGAGTITVEIENGGRRRVRVSDDGVGIPSAEARLAFARHSTSKLQTVDDLDRIQTLGFRGEALASIAAVSRTTMITRHGDEASGVSVLVEGGEVRSVQPVGAPVGTVVAVEHLFFNTPARLKFLKAESTERRHISQIVTRYAMAYPQVRFRLVQEGREQLRTTGSGDLADVLVEAFGLDDFKAMVEVSPQPPPRPDVPPVEVYGFTSLPELSRTRRDQIILFVNGRSIVDQTLTYAVMQAYRDLLPPGRHPAAVLLITLPPEDVDVNVHPTKAEVRFRVPDAVFAAVQRAVRLALSGVEAGSSLGSGSAGGEWGVRGAARAYTPVPGEEQVRWPGSKTHDDSGSRDEQLDMGLEIGDPGRYTGLGAAYKPAETAIPAGPGTPLRPRTLPIMRVIGQVGAAYIVAEGPAGLYLIDQHAAPTRGVYETLARRVAAGDAIEQVQIQATAVDLPPALAGELEGMLPVLGTLGFDGELFGNATFRVRAMPAPLVYEDPGEVLAAIAAAGASDSEGDMIEAILRQIARMGAAKAGQILTLDAMQGMVQELERCTQPRVDLDGGPTLIHMSGEDLARQFGRRV